MEIEGVNGLILAWQSMCRLEIKLPIKANHEEL